MAKNKKRKEKFFVIFSSHKWNEDFSIKTLSDSFLHRDWIQQYRDCSTRLTRSCFSQVSNTLARGFGLRVTDGLHKTSSLEADLALAHLSSSHVISSLSHCKRLSLPGSHPHVGKPLLQLYNLSKFYGCEMSSESLFSSQPANTRRCVQKFSDFIIFQGLVLTSSYLGKLRLVMLVIFLQIRYLTEAPYQLCFTRPGSLASPWLWQQACPWSHWLPSGSVLHSEIQR